MKPTVDEIAKSFKPFDGIESSRFCEFELRQEDQKVWHEIWPADDWTECTKEEANMVCAQTDGEAYLAVCIAYGRVRGYEMIESKEGK